MLTKIHALRGEANVALYIILTQGIGGAERRLIRIYNRIANTRPVDLVVRGVEKDVLMEICEKADIDLSNYHALFTFDMNLSSYFECLSFFRKKKYAVIHFFDFSLSYILLSIVRPRETKLLCTIANYDLIKRENYRKMKLLLPRVDHVDCFYPDGEAFISSIAGRDNVSVTPGTYTDLDVFYPEKKERMIVFTAARLTFGKNAMLLVQGAGICQDIIREEGYRIIILGQGYEEQKIKAKIVELGIEDIVDMVGYARTSEYVRSAGIFVSLQKEENYPSQSLAEGVAAGCFIIMTDTGNSREGVGDFFSILIEDDPSAMADAIKTYIGMPEEKKEIAVRAARKFAEKKYNIEASIKYFEEILVNL